ncbi:MAG: hypothetical protein ACRDNP_13810 [Gaiellaceae bacterium]
MSEDLIARAKASSEGFVVPETWGEVVELEEDGGVFVGRYRGQETDTRSESIYLFWGEDDEPRFFWHAYRLKQGMEAREPGARRHGVRLPRRELRDEVRRPGRALGHLLRRGAETNAAPLPEMPSTDDGPAAWAARGRENHA